MLNNSERHIKRTNPYNPIVVKRRGDLSVQEKKQISVSIILFAEFLGGSFFSSLDNLNRLGFTTIILKAKFSKRRKGIKLWEPY